MHLLRHIHIDAFADMSMTVHCPNPLNKINKVLFNSFLLCSFLPLFCAAEPERAPPARLPGPGGLLGHAAAVHREHQPQVRRAAPAQSQRLEAADAAGDPGDDWLSASGGGVARLTRMLTCALML